MTNREILEKIKELNNRVNCLEYKLHEHCETINIDSQHTEDEKIEQLSIENKKLKTALIYLVFK